MSLVPGSKLGPHEILAQIGAGGMGEVYRARDTRLKREVALKVLPEAFANDPARMARFQREAEVLASLNHPNIAHLYGIEDGALVMELVEGETLPCPVPVETALRYARQIAEALEYAHERGVVHRDLKPANIKITPEGVVKVLDFGLAKAIDDPVPHADPSNSPTLTLGATRLGMIMGTAAYMSPEQANGKAADRRADIWSFGAVLYEMLSGKRAFGGESAPDTLATVMKLDPDWNALPAGTPESIRKLVRRCLTKDRRQRLQAIGEARIALENPGGGEVAPRQEKPRPWLAWSAAGVVTLALAALAFIHFREQPPAAELSRFQIPLPAGATLAGTFVVQEVSPDGRKLGFAAAGADGKLRLWIRSFDSLDPWALPGVELGNAVAPFFWSYNSRSVAFLSSDNKLKKADVSGGPVQTLCDAANLVGGSWGRDGVILFAEGEQNGVKRVSAAGGTPIALTAVDPARQERGHLFPKLLPDGRHFLYFRDSTTPGNSGIYVGAIDAKPSGQSFKPLMVNENFQVGYVPFGNSGHGHLLFYRAGTFLAQPFNPNSLELSGDPVPVAEQTGGPASGGLLSASTNGVLTYGGGSIGNFQLTWFDREGKNLGTLGEPGVFNTLALSRDGKQAAASRIEPSTRITLWLYDLTRGGAPARFTFNAFTDHYPVFSPDGSRIVFMSSRDGPGNLYQKLTSGAKEEEPLLKSDQEKTPDSWSRDGNYLLYTVHTPKTKDDVWILPMDGSKKPPMPFQATEFNETGAQFSPDGHWIAYDSDATGRYEVYVREFSLGSDGKPEATAPHLISSGGGRRGFWRDDGKELSYLSADGKTVMSAEITTQPVFQVSPLKALFQLPAGVNAAGVNEAPVVTADGKRFLVTVPVAQNGPQQFTVVQNWQAELKK